MQDVPNETERQVIRRHLLARTRESFEKNGVPASYADVLFDMLDKTLVDIDEIILRNIKAMPEDIYATAAVMYTQAIQMQMGYLQTHILSMLSDAGYQVCHIEL